MTRLQHPETPVGPLHIWILSLWLGAGFCLTGMVPAARADTAVDQPPAQAAESTVEELALVLSTFFLTASGTVLSIDGDRVELDLGTAQGVRPALTLTVYRVGEPFRHPLTGVPMASSETILGGAIVEHAEPGRAVARLLEPPSEPLRAGDRVRLTADRLPIALASTSPAVAARLLLALEETGRFRAKPLVFSQPLPSFIGAPAQAADATPGARWAAFARDARAQQADYLFVFDVQVRGGLAAGAVAIVETRTGRLVDSVETPLRLRPEEYPSDLSDPVLRTLAANSGRAVREAQFSYRAEHAVVGDLDGDGVEELVVSDGHRLRLYRMDERGDGLSPTLLAEEPSGRPGRRHLALDLADIHGLGRPQLFVTAMAGDRLDSYVLVWKDGQLTRVAGEQPYYFRVLRAPARPPLLLAQRRGLSAPFAGDVRRMRWTGGTYEEGDAVALPSSVGIYDFTMADLDGDGRDELLYLDRQDHLIAMSVEGRRLGASDVSFGGVESFIEYVPAGITKSSQDAPARARVLARMVVADLDGDGTLEVVVPKNVPLTTRFERLRGYQYGQIYALGWEGDRFVQKWVIPKVEGVIADIGLARAPGGDGAAQVLVLANPTARTTIMRDFFAKSSQLLLYAVPQG